MMPASGGSFLQRSASPASVFTPEDLSEEQRMIRELARRFLREEVLPRQESIENQDWQITVDLLKRCGELGLLGIEVPAEYGGEGLDKVSAMLVAESFAPVASFGVSFGGQAGIGALPFVYFGTDDQKRRFLPGICNGSILAAYALSEASSGSDALSAKTSASLTADRRHYVLNGEKMWITNAAFADIFVTFAQVDGTQFSCFVVEKRRAGVSIGAEERKMGLKGSSTRPVVFNNVLVPVENLIGEVGKGHHVAFNILNIGRAKLGAIAVGAGKAALRESTHYARRRISFGKPIAYFGAIRHKVADMAIRLWVTESMVYRTAGVLDTALAALASADSRLWLETIRSYAVECSVLKVFGSEVLDFVVDEAVQIHGGYGFSADYPVERYYRDARVNRIFEGTNEINRLLIASTVLKRKLEEGYEPATTDPPVGFAAEVHALSGARAVLRKLAGLARKAFPDSIKEEQEVMMHMADIIMDIYAIDSSVARAAKTGSAIHAHMVRAFVDDAVRRITAAALAILPAVANGAELAMHVAEARQLMEWPVTDTITVRRGVADYVFDLDEV